MQTYIDGWAKVVGLRMQCQGMIMKSIRDRLLPLQLGLGPVSVPTHLTTGALT